MKTKIAIIHGPMVTGGTAKALVNLFHYFDYSKYEVTLWTTKNEGDLLPQVDPHVNVQFYEGSLRERYKTFFLDLIKKGKGLSLWYSLYYHLLYCLFKHDKHRAPYYKIRSRLIRKQEPYDVVILYQALPQSLLYLALGLFQSSHHIAWIHGNHRNPLSQRETAEHLSLYKEFDQVVCVSNAVKNIFLTYYPSLGDRVSVIYNLQDISSIQAKAEEPLDVPFAQTTLVTVGRISSEKGQEMIPEIAENLRRKGYRFKWYVIGSQVRNCV